MTALSNLVAQWNNPTAAADRVVEYNDWSAAFDASHPLRTEAERQEILVTRDLKARMGGVSVVSKGMLK